MIPTNLRVLGDGTVEGLYTEAIELHALGRLRMRRATSIEFDEDAQLWRVLQPDGRELHAARSREDCLRWERAFFNQDVG